jgi:hypothetical protein
MIKGASRSLYSLTPAALWREHQRLGRAAGWAMDKKQFELVMLSGASTGLCVIAAIYGHWLAAVIFVALTCGTAVVAAMTLRRLP